MKSKLMKIWGVMLVLAVLAALLIPAASPVSAANMAWTSINTPATGPTNILVTSTLDPKVEPDYIMAASADGTDLFAYDNANKKYYRSTNGGATWSNVTTSGLPADAEVTAIALSNDYANDKVVLVTTTAAVYASSNGGTNFGVALSNVTDMFAGGTITSVAASPYYTGAGTAFLVGVKGATVGTGGVALYVPGGYGGNWSKIILETAGVDVYAVAFSPNHRADALSIFVTADASGAYIQHKFGPNTINDEYGKLKVGAVNGVSNAVIAFPKDYEVLGNNTLFVGFKATTDSDVYRIRLSNKTYGGDVTSTWSRLNASGGSATQVNSLSFKGNLADGWLYLGQDNGTIKRATATTGSTVTFTIAQKNPMGAKAVVAAPGGADTAVCALTSGAGSSFATSNDGGVNFEQVSLIYVSTANVKINDLAVIDADNMYLILKDGDTTILFKSTNGGANWKGMFSEASASVDLKAIYPSKTYATDKTFYITQDDNRIWKSTNGGTSFIGLSAPSAANGDSSNILSFALIDANTYLVGTTNGLFRSGSYAVGTGGTGAVTSIARIDAEKLYVATGGGRVFFSANNGVSFTPFTRDPFATSGTTLIKADVNFATNNILYAAQGTNVKRFTVGTSLDWASMTIAATSDITQIAQGTDGTMYVAAEKMYRHVTPAAPGPQTISSIVFTGASYPDSTSVCSANLMATGTPEVPNNTIYAVFAKAGEPNKVFTFQDTLVSPPGVTTPRANSEVATNTNFAWAAPAGSTGVLEYKIEVAYDPAFQNTLVTSGLIKGTLTTPDKVGVTLNPGQTYYWRVRVETSLPSKWSAATKFSVLLTQAGNTLEGPGGNTIQPAPGATNVPVKPVFQWAAVNGAASYDLQVADNPVFVNPLDSQTGLNTTVWTYTKALEPGKTYYWRIRAVSAAAVNSAWVNGAFTTAVPAPTVAPPATTVAPPQVVTPTITVNIPTQPAPIVTVTVPPATATAPTTPASVWVLIAIGAVLIIAVIVLIARTRRV